MTAPGLQTVGMWLAALEPPPPPALATRLSELLAPHVERPAGEVPDACLDAGERALAVLLATDAASRESALDLLAIDALVTYAFQMAADVPETLEPLALRAMTRIAAIRANRTGARPQ